MFQITVLNSWGSQDILCKNLKLLKFKINQSLILNNKILHTKYIKK
jgi:hypothetical protein